MKRAEGTHRSIPVAKYLKTYNTPELSVATPPTESPKYILRRAAMRSNQQLMHIDVTRACCYADAVGNMYVQLPTEDQ